LSPNIHQWVKYAGGKNDALITNSTKHALNSDAGIALCVVPGSPLRVAPE